MIGPLQKSDSHPDDIGVFHTRSVKRNAEFVSMEQQEASTNSSNT